MYVCMYVCMYVSDKLRIFIFFLVIFHSSGFLDSSIWCDEYDYKLVD